MFRDYLCGTQRLAKAVLTLCAVAAFCGGAALTSQAQPAPSNDNLTNATGLVGLTGTAHGTNLQATVQTKEPDPFPGVPPLSTIWYGWTAPTTTAIDFNTRGSVDDISGQPLHTMLGVYTNKGTNRLSVTNLVQVAGNILDPSSNLFTSRVDFNANMGTTYYIQVGSTTNVFDNATQGNIQLNWAPSLLAGGFAFSTSVFPIGSLDNFVIDGGTNNSIAPSIFGLGNGSANARITVTRLGGFTGRCEVLLNVGTGFYTNTYVTNYTGTNITILTCTGG